MTIEIEVTPNRPDLLSHLGVAREVAAFYRTSVRWPEAGNELQTVEEDRGVRIRILDGEGCRRAARAPRTDPWPRGGSCARAATDGR